MGLEPPILRDLGISKLKLISNNPQKRIGLTLLCLEITEYAPLETQGGIPFFTHSSAISTETVDIILWLTVIIDEIFIAGINS